MVGRQRTHEANGLTGDGDGIADRAAVTGYRSSRELKDAFDEAVQPIVLDRDVADDAFGQFRVVDRAAFENADVADRNRQRRSQFVPASARNERRRSSPAARESNS